MSVQNTAQPINRGTEPLRTAYLDLYSLAAQMIDGQIPPGQARPLRVLVEEHLKNTWDQLLAAGLSRSLADEAQFPVMCLLDEAAKRHPAFGQQWGEMAHASLGTLAGGEEVFKQLQRLLANPRAPVELVEIYVRCLFLGFQGMYAPDRMKELQFLLDNVRGDLRERLGPLPLLAPHLGPPVQSRRLRPVMPFGWVLVIAVLCLSLLTLGLRLSLSLRAGEVSGELSKQVQGAKAEGREKKAAGAPEEHP